MGNEANSKSKDFNFLPDYITFETLHEYVGIEDSNLFKNYLHNIFMDISIYDEKHNKKLINKISFYDYMKLPIFIAEKLFNSFDRDNDNNLEEKDFINNLIKLYCGTFYQTTEIIFNLLDYDKDGKIQKDDVTIMLSFLPLSNNEYDNNEIYEEKQRNSRKEINEIINKTFSKYNGILKFNQFVDVVKNKKSDVYLELICYFYQMKPFTKENINLVKDNNNEDEYKNLKYNNNNNFDNENYKEENQIKIKLSKKKSGLSPAETFLKHNSFERNINNKKNYNYNIQNANVHNAVDVVRLCNENIISESFEKKDKSNINYKDCISHKRENYSSPSKYLLEEQKIRPMTSHFTIKEILNPINEEKENDYSDNKFNNNNNNNNNNHNHYHNYNHQKINKNYSPIKYKSINKNLCKICLYKKFSIDTTLKEEKEENKKNNKSYDSNNNNNIYNYLSYEKTENKTKIKYENWIYKILENNKIRKFYLVISNKDIYYYDDETKNKFIGMHHLSGCLIKEPSEKEYIEIEKTKFYSFSITFNNKSKTRIYYSPNLDIAQKFNETFKKVIGYIKFNDYYEIQEMIGKGKFGVVNLGIHKKTGKKVAIKIINKSSLKTEEDKELVKSEIDIMKLCHHPNIVKLLDHFENSEFIYIVMEYLSGGTLNQYIKKHYFNFTESQTANIIKQIANGIKYLHNYGIIHRDLKTDNIMLTKNNDNGIIKIMDFGLSKIVGPKEGLIEGYGTLSYVAPEVLMREPYNKEIDIWSLGIILYFMLCGHFPFQGNKETIVAKNIVYQPVNFDDEEWENRSKKVIDLIERSLEKKPSKRISIEEFLKHPWFKKNVKQKLSL